MRSLLKSLLALLAAFLLMMAMRALVFTIYLVDGEGLAPEFLTGDRVLVNRWSYGLRTGIRIGNNTLFGPFGYGRLWRQPVGRGDIVAYENPLDSTRSNVLFGRVTALPGDTISHQGHTLQLPSLADCADADYYWIEALNEANPLDSRQLGYISECLIIGRAFLVLYAHDPQEPFWRGYYSDRFLLPK